MTEMSQYEEYRAFINSPEWDAIRYAFLTGKTCFICGATHDLEAHHVMYRKGVKGYCDMSTLIPLCKACHDKVSMLDYEIRRFWFSFKNIQLDMVRTRMGCIRYSLTHDNLPREKTDQIVRRFIHSMPAATMSENKYLWSKDKDDVLLPISEILQRGYELSWERRQ